MGDLELSSTGSGLVIDGEPLAIATKVSQMPAFLRAITPVMQQIGGDGIDWLALFGERGDDLLTAVSIAVGKTPPRGSTHSMPTRPSLLAAKVLEVNADFTRTVMPRLDGLIAQTSAAGGSDHGWFDTVQHLIGHGHRLPDILDYTLAQVRGFAAATARGRRTRCPAAR